MAQSLSRGSRISLWIVILFCGGVGSLLLPLSVRELRDADFFIKHSVEVEAVWSASVKGYCVSETRSRTGGVRIKKYDCYTPEVRYVFDGKTYTRKMHDMKSPTNVPVGAPVVVRLHDRGRWHDVRFVSGFMDLAYGSFIVMAFALLMLLVAVLGVGSEVRRAVASLKAPSPG
ncbi:MAG: hypothetical protein EOO71_24885 [Myxococcaceae bacterium]|nr:MAG: hypothetical protein EOO71_24885 [Myxococcaceae bacterium]